MHETRKVVSWCMKWWTQSQLPPYEFNRRETAAPRDAAPWRSMADGSPSVLKEGGETNACQGEKGTLIFRATSLITTCLGAKLVIHSCSSPLPSYPLGGRRHTLRTQCAKECSRRAPFHTIVAYVYIAPNSLIVSQQITSPPLPSRTPPRFHVSVDYSAFFDLDFSAASSCLRASTAFLSKVNVRWLLNGRFSWKKSPTKPNTHPAAKWKREQERLGIHGRFNKMTRETLYLSGYVEKDTGCTSSTVLPT